MPLNSSTRPAGVVFDLGNVLIDWDPSAAIAAGVGPVEARRFLNADDFDFMAWNHGPDSGGSWDDAEAAVRRSHPHWVEHALAYRANFAASLLGEVPGVVDVVRDLHEHDVPLVGLTNWSDELYPHAPRRFPFLELLDDVVVSGTVGAAKPDRRAYEIAAERIGLPLGRLAFVDDKQLNVDAAAALGMAAILFTDAAALRTELRSRGLPV
ncbi:MULTISPECIES: HAD-IA family hydrolase [unclassified Nocardioides]|uniref:HAD-IA family hydrolase n=1 Tax=unclassified Nocardioides TaxID=2615069 RepID=UPI0009F0C84A|nr:MULTISPECIES: HAD-IA family hydrolase [unclassified Nocardioides]GAW52078.1 HAD family hydrolase [Nocardioides sp. PD653-B2]GAW57191.1 HAD family hydrolase [Nocardioides sp. PD653]